MALFGNWAELTVTNWALAVAAVCCIRFLSEKRIWKRPCFFFVEWWNTKKRATVLALFLSS